MIDYIKWNYYNVWETKTRFSAVNKYVIGNCGDNDGTVKVVNS